MLRGLDVVAQGLGRPGPKGVDNDVEARKVGLHEREDVLALDGFARRGLILPTHDGGNVVTAIHGLLGDELAGLAVGCDDCDLHDCAPIRGSPHIFGGPSRRLFGQASCPPTCWGYNPDNARHK